VWSVVSLGSGFRLAARLPAQVSPISPPVVSVASAFALVVEHSGIIYPAFSLELPGGLSFASVVGPEWRLPRKYLPGFPTVLV